MQKAIVLDANDVKALIASHFKVEESAVIKSQYSYTVIGVDVERNEDGNDKDIADDNV